LVGAENGRPSLEVRFRSDGHPPFTEREREIHLNGICGVKFCRRPGLLVDPGLFLFSNAEYQIQAFEIRSLTSTISRDARPARS
jgi:hypothetical protein